MSDVNFKGGYREIAYRYELLDRNFNVVGDITDRVGNCTIEHNSFTPVNRTAKFNLKEYTGEAPATIKGNYENQYWTASTPNSKWSTIDCWLNDNFISFPKYQQYSGADHEFNSGQKWVDGGSSDSIPNTGWEIMVSGSTTYKYLPNGGMLNLSGRTSSAQQIYKNSNTSTDYAVLRSTVSTPVSNKRVYFCGYFKSPQYSKPDIFVYYSGGTNEVSLEQVPTGNITTINVSSTGNSNDWKWFEGYVDLYVHSGYTTARMAIGCKSVNVLVNNYIIVDTFYFDFDRATPFRFQADASLEIDISIADALNQANNFVTSLCSLTPTLEYGWVSPQVKAPVTKLEWSVSFNGGSTWSTYTDGNLLLFQDARNARIRLRFTCESYTQMFKPKVKWWILRVGALTNMVNMNRDKIDFAQHRIKPYLQIKNSSGNWQEHPLGVFLMSSPKRADKDKSIYKEIEAYDQLTILSQAKLMYPLCLYPPRDNPQLSGQKGGWAKAAKDLLLGVYPITGYGGREGITPGQIWNSSYVNIPDDVFNLPNKSRGRNFKMGETWLAVINQLLNAAGYTPIFCNSNGVLTSIPYVSPDQKPVKHTYIDDETSIIFQEASEELDTFEVANSWVAYQPADQNAIELTGRYTNNNQGHPSSVPTLGRMITDYRDVTGMEGQAEIDRYVYHLAYEASQVYGQINFTTALDPNHEEADIVYLRYQDLGIDGKFVETAWSMELSDDPHMTHRLRRIVSI